jgi:uncharacterized membrane protein
MKLRLILMGCIISVIGGALLIIRGYSPELVGVLIVGIALLVVGLLWKQTKKADSIHKDTN